MGPNELLLWMSARQSGTWSQFRSTVEEMGLDEDEIGREGKAAIPSRVRLRLNLDRLAHVEFNDLNGDSSWRVAPPVLASTNLSGKCIGVLCGARSIPIMAIANIQEDTYVCRNCDEQANFGKCTIPYAYKLLTQLLLGAGISTKFRMEESKK